MTVIEQCSGLQVDHWVVENVREIFPSRDKNQAHITSGWASTFESTSSYYMPMCELL